MKKNVGNFDRLARILFGFIFLFVGYFLHPLFYLFSFLLFATALFRFCGLYTLLGVRTCPLNEEGNKEKK
jgi:hypothetical protein